MKLPTLFALSIFVAVPAQATIVECAIFPREAAWDWFAPKIRFEYDEGSDEAKVTDAVIMAKQGKPATAKIVSSNNKRTTFVWAVSAKSMDQQFVAKGVPKGGVTTFSKVKFRLTYFLTSGTASISALSGVVYSTEPTSNGTCTIFR